MNNRMANEAVAWLKSRYATQDFLATYSRDHDNLLSWRCDATIPSTGVTEAGVAFCRSEAAQLAAIGLAKALGWEPTSP